MGPRRDPRACPRLQHIVSYLLTFITLRHCSISAAAATAAAAVTVQHWVGCGRQAGAGHAGPSAASGSTYKPTHGRPQHPPLHRRRAARHMKIRTRYTRHIDRMAARARNWGATTNRLRGAICRKAPKNACRGGAPVKHLAHPPIRFSSAGGAIQCLSKNTASNTRSVCWPTPLNGSPQR